MRRPHAQLLAAALAALNIAGDWPGAGESLTADYRSAPAPRRCALVAEAAARGEGTRDVLLTLALQDPSEAVVVASLRAIARHRVRSLGEAVIQRLGDERVGVRLAAVEAARAIRDPASLPALARVAGDSDVGVRTLAVAALAALGVEAAVLALVDRVHDPESVVRLAALTALGELGDSRAVLSVLGLLDDPNPDVRVVAASALGRMRDARSVRALRVALGDEHTNVRIAAVRALGSLGSDAAAAVDDLAPIALRGVSMGELADASLASRAAIDSLTAIASSEAAAHLARVAMSPRVEDHTALAEALSRSPRAFIDRVAAALGRIESPSLTQLSLLGVIGGVTAADTILGSLARVDSDHGLGAALVALGRSGDPRAVRVLLRYGTQPEAAEGSASTRTARRHTPCAERPAFQGAIEGLLALSRRQGGLPATALDPLLAMANVPSASCGEAIAQVISLIGATGNSRAGGALARWAGGDDRRVRLAALRALEGTGGAPLAPLILLLSDASDELRLAAADAIARHATRADLAQLIARIDSPERVDRATAMRVVGIAAARLGAFDVARGPLLAAIARDDLLDAAAAIDALSRLAAAGAPGISSAIVDAGSRRSALRGVVVEALGNALVDGGGRSDGEVVAALRRFDARGPAAVLAERAAPDSATRLIGALQSLRTAESTNAAAALALGAGDLSAPTLEDLCVAWRGASDSAMRGNLGMALLRRGAPCSLEVMNFALRADSPETTRRAIASGAGLRADDSAAQRFLHQCSQGDASSAVARHCADLLSRGSLPREDLDLRVSSDEGPVGGLAALRVTLADGVELRVTPGPDGWIHLRQVAAGAFSVSR